MMPIETVENYCSNISIFSPQYYLSLSYSITYLRSVEHNQILSFFDLLLTNETIAIDRNYFLFSLELFVNIFTEFEVK